MLVMRLLTLLKHFPETRFSTDRTTLALPSAPSPHLHFYRVCDHLGPSSLLPQMNGWNQAYPRCSSMRGLFRYNKPSLIASRTHKRTVARMASSLVVINQLSHMNGASTIQLSSCRAIE